MAGESGRPIWPKRAIVTCGMPYGNKGLHFGHIGGVFIPADAFARFLRDRIGADNVILVSGTDCYGSPIAEAFRKLQEEGFQGSIEEYVEENHNAQKAALDAYGISMNVYEGSGMGLCKDEHKAMTDWVFQTLYDNGWLEKLSTAQFYDETAQTFLNGRQVVGRCPFQGCKSEKAYADECDLGHQFMPEDLIAPKSSITGETPSMRQVDNWYFKLPESKGLIEEHIQNMEKMPATRAITCTTMREFLVPPIIYVKNEHLEDYQGLANQLPAHSFREAEKGKASFELEFADLADRDAARTVLNAADIRYRTGKCLVPFRLTGNIEWGVPAPQLEDEDPLTVWCWPESLWAPISFSSAWLKANPAGHEDAPTWQDWWCSDDAGVYQFIGQDNIYFYGVAQTGLWCGFQGPEGQAKAEGTGEQLRQTTLVPNYHVLFMNKKASSSGAIKPPMAADLLDNYTAEQLRAHFLSLGLGLKSVSFQPKAYDPDADDKAADPVLKESALLTNIFNRVARSCFYTAQKHFGGYLPLGPISQDVLDGVQDVVERYEQAMARFELWTVMAIMDGYIRDANKRWTTKIREAEEADDDEARAQVLRDTFHILKTATVLMHPITPEGTEKIASFFALDSQVVAGKAANNPHHHDMRTAAEANPMAGFFSWEHLDQPIDVLLSEEERAAGRHLLKELPPKTDFFEKHPSQFGE